MELIAMVCQFKSNDCFGLFCSELARVLLSQSIIIIWIGKVPNQEPFPIFNMYGCRRRYWKQASCKYIILCIVGPLLRQIIVGDCA